jgi:hypothetical protein
MQILSHPYYGWAESDVDVLKKITSQHGSGKSHDGAWISIANLPSRIKKCLWKFLSYRKRVFIVDLNG